jgi:DNA polymerase-3 subunit delta
LVRERAERAARVVVPNPADPFRITELTPAAIKDDPARLADEVGALAFGGGRRVVKLRGGGDGTVAAIESALSLPSNALLIVEAGELSPRSSLRRLFERAEAAAAVACYEDNADATESIVRGVLRNAGLRIDDDAMHRLLHRVSGDRAQVRGELDKLILYAGGEQGVVGAADVEAVIGDGAELSLDQVCEAVGLGDLAALDRAITRAAREGIGAVTLLRAVARHLLRLHLASAELANGRSIESVMGSLRPPVFFAVQSGFRRQLAAWSPGRLAEAIQLIQDAEADCKTTGLPAHATCARALLRIAGAARAGRANG